MGAFHHEVVGMFPEEFPPGLFYQVGVSAKCLKTAWFECSVPGQDLSLLGAGGSFQSCLQGGSTQRHALHGIGGGMSSFGPKRLLGHWCGRNG